MWLIIKSLGNNAKQLANRGLQLNIEIKNIKHSEFASHETNCFEATIYIDGKKVGYVENDGQGGSNNYLPYSIYEQLTTYAKTLPQTEFNGEFFDKTADCIIDDLLTNHLLAKNLKKMLGKRILFVTDDQKIMQTEIFKQSEQMAKALSDVNLAIKLKAKTILNNVDFATALQLFKQYA